MEDKTEDKKPQLVQPPIPTGSVYEAFRKPVPGAPAATVPVDAAAATAAATSVEPGLQAAILNMLPQWKPLLQRVDALEEGTGEDAAPQLSKEFLEDFATLKEKIEGVVHVQGVELLNLIKRVDMLTEAVKDTEVLKQRQDELAGRLDAMDTRINERLDALASVVAELQEELGNDDDDDQGTPPKEK